MAYSTYYNADAKILFYILGKKVKKKRHKLITYAFSKKPL
jgi:hypothetical protein